MSIDLAYLQHRFPDLLPYPVSKEGGITAYQLQLPNFPLGREFKRAELILPKGFPEQSKALIQLSSDAVMRVPHIDSNGVLCTQGDPGPNSGYSPEDRIYALLYSYQEDFLRPWISGNLDSDFENESLNYWAIQVTSTYSKTDPVRGVWTVDSCPPKTTVRNGLLLIPNRIIIAADAKLQITNRIIHSMAYQAQQRVGVLIAEIPITHPFSPKSWPNTSQDLDQILNSRLTPSQYQKFLKCRSRRGRSMHRVVLLRNKNVAYAYLLPGGPPTVINIGERKKTFIASLKPLPLFVTRFDPSWTVGRDQHPEVEARQNKHILIFGAGALGSSVIDLLAKAGLGRISLVDDDCISSANIGRHFLGAESVGQKKVSAIAKRINSGYPATEVVPYVMAADKWFKTNSLSNIDAVLDLTGEPDVRVLVEYARKANPCSLLIGWMEPYVASAHACILPVGHLWFREQEDKMRELEAVEWPKEVVLNEPGCSSQFQSYTASAASYAIALIAENAIKMIDEHSEASKPLVLSWVRGQQYLDKQWPGLRLKEWAASVSSFDGVILSRDFS